MPADERSAHSIQVYFRIPASIKGPSRLLESKVLSFYCVPRKLDLIDEEIDDPNPHDGEANKYLTWVIGSVTHRDGHVFVSAVPHNP